MKTKSVPSGWFQRDGRRLDCGPYMSGALEASVQLERLAARKDRLADLTQGHKGGIYNGPQFKRNYVESLEYGVPFLTGGDVLKADLSGLPLLSRRDANSSKLNYLRLYPGMTLISCSGAIGRMAYVRPDMDGVWSSQDVMKIVPDPEKIPPGYVFAYLSSKFGVPLVVGGTYGAIIQHIEPQHIADLPVPRLGDRIECEVHKLIDGASVARSQASELLRKANEELAAALGLPSGRRQHEYPSPQVSMAWARELRCRADAFYYAPINTDARVAFDNVKGEQVAIGDIADVFIPGIFKRQYADDPQFGVPYITGADVFQLAPTSTQYLLKRLASDVRLVLRRGMIVIQEAGQLGGLIGRPVLVGKYLDGFSCTNNMVRVTVKNSEDVGYLFAVLASTQGIRLVTREAAGSSIPHLEAGRIGALRIPWVSTADRKRIGAFVTEAQQLRDFACDMEARARELVEQTIENGAN